MNLLKNTADNIIKEYVFKTYSKINVQAGKCRYNYRCHINAVHDATINNEESIAICICIIENTPIIHFINVNNNVYTDNTLGVWATQYNYYLVRLVHKDDFFHIGSIFGDYRHELFNKLPLRIRIFGHIDF